MIITNKLKSGWELKATVKNFGKKYHAFIELSNRKYSTKYFNALHKVGSQSLEEIEGEINGFEVMEQVVRRYEIWREEK